MNIKNDILLREILAENLKQRRIKLSLSQEQLGSLCKMHRTFIGSIERCERNVSLNTLSKLSLSLEATVPELLTKWTENEK